MFIQFLSYVIFIHNRDEKFYAYESDCGLLRFDILKCYILFVIVSNIDIS